MGRASALGFNLALVGLSLLVLWLLYALVRSNVLPESSVPLVVEEAVPHNGDIPQIDIRNGAGVSGLADSMRVFLRSRGYDVVEVGNHTSFNEPQTLILDRVGNPDIARRLATTLKLGEDRIVEDIRQDYFLDASVIIGKDFFDHAPFARDEASNE